jgi:putative polyhydroxyalkanoate system protein
VRFWQRDCTAIAMKPEHRDRHPGWQSEGNLMATIDIVRSHGLGRDKARAAVERIAHEISSKLQADTQWEGDSLAFSRSGANGRIDVEDHKVRVNVDLGLMLSPMRGMIEQQINSYLDEYF